MNIFLVEKVNECFEMDIGVDYLGIYSIVVLGVMCMFWYNVGNSIEL